MGRIIREGIAVGTQSTVLFIALIASSGIYSNHAVGQQGVASTTAFNVIHYDADIEPDLINKTLKGRETIRFVARADRLAGIEIDCGELTIDTAFESGIPLQFSTKDRKLHIVFSGPSRANETHQVELSYHVAPKRGIRFFAELQQVYTVFSTSQWMVCVDAPDDKATLTLRLILPPGLSNVANGRLVSTTKLSNERVIYEWRQDHPVPTYIFGFAVGRFHTVTERRGSTALRYLAPATFSDEQLRRIFRDTADMITFYEDHAGVRYADRVYTQVLAAGGVEQEMSSFTAIPEKYGNEVLADERADWLAAHELAHQWWGNMVTCRDWNHFWLNEGIASFMASAYREHRFGHDAYQHDIDKYRVSYEEVRDAGKDRSLVFPDWLHPTAADRTLVYDKGAYVMHLLRIEMGERAFWAGMRQYTQTYFGKSVTTPDFQMGMEKAYGKSLGEFFSKWVYLTKS